MQSEMLVEKFESDKYILEIHIDEFGVDPRKDDNLTKIVCFHRRYSLPKELEIDHDDYASWDEMERALVKKGALFIHPIYMLDHSGVWVSLEDYNDSWDSGQVGFIFIMKEDFKKEYGRMTKANKEKALNVLKGEFHDFACWISGDIYGFKLYKKVKCGTCEHVELNEIDSCWGFYGDYREIFKSGYIDAEILKELKVEVANGSN